MMKQKMEKAQIPDLEDILTMAQMEGVEFIACQMTVDMMELSKDDFIEGVEIWNAEDFLKYAKNCNISLFT
jgi:peroxiredoxin family protein